MKNNGCKEKLINMHFKILTQNKTNILKTIRIIIQYLKDPLSHISIDYTSKSEFILKSNDLRVLLKTNSQNMVWFFEDDV